MYQYEEFSDGHVLVTHTSKKYRARFRATDAAAASQVVCDLNLPGMLERLAAHRYEIETQGINIGGMMILTDRESQTQLNATYTTLNAGFISSTRWKGPEGWQTVDITAIEPLAQAVAQHVDKCFQTEESVEIQLRAITDHTEMASFQPEEEFDAEFAAV